MFSQHVLKPPCLIADVAPVPVFPSDGRSRARASVFLTAIATLLTAIVGSMTPASASTVTLKAESADRFVDSIGVNVHMQYDDTPYGNVNLVLNRLQQLGVKHVRDGMTTGRPDFYQALNRLADKGIRSTLIMGSPTSGPTLPALIDQVKTSLPNAVEAFEGPNEYYFTGLGWESRLAPYQQQLFSLINADPALRDLPVIGPSAPSVDVSSSLDYGNIHPYPGGNNPSRNIAWELDAAKLVSGSKQVIATESGYHNAVNTTDGHRPASESAAAAYTQRMHLEYFKSGIARTFSYELIDAYRNAARDDPQSHFGLLRYDGTPKPAFMSLKHLILVLDDRSPENPSWEPTNLDVGIEGPSDVRSLLLQKRDGTYELVLWRDLSLYDTATARDISVPSANVSVTLPSAYSSAIYRPSVTATPYGISGAKTSLRVQVPADPIIVELRSVVTSSATSTTTSATSVVTAKSSAIMPRRSTGVVSKTRRL